MSRNRTLYIDADACPVTREALVCARRARVPRGSLGDLAFPLPDEATRVTLFRSILGPDGARYKPLYTAELEDA